MKLLNQNILDPKKIDLSLIPGDNKTDSICSLFQWGLSFEQQEYMKAHYDDYKGDLHPFACKVFDDPKFKKQDPRFVGAFKPYYGKVGRIKRKEGGGRHNFSDEEILFIIESASYRKPQEIAKDIFIEENEDDDKGFLNKVSADISFLIKAFGIEYDGPKGEFTAERLTDSDYKVPETDEQLLKKIISNVPGCQWRKSSLDAHQRKCLRFLQSNLMSLHFLRTINSIKDAGLRELFEQEFIKHVYDKPDLIPEDINSYISLASTYIDLFTVNERMYVLDKDFKVCAQGDDSSKGAAMRGLIVEQIAKISKQRDDIKNQIQKISKSLTGNREQRLAKETERSQSVARIVNDCADEKKRELLINAARARNEKLKNHVHEVEGYDGVNKGEINGISIEEILGYTHTPL